MKNNMISREVSLKSNLMVKTFPLCECCNRPEAVDMTLGDIHRIATHLNVSLESVYDEYCALMMNLKTNGPLAVVLKPKGKTMECPFKNGCKCSLGEAKPYACRIAPIVRNFIPHKGRDASWRVAHFLMDGAANLGSVRQSVADCLSKAGATETEVSFGHLHLALVEANVCCARLYDLTGKPFDREVMRSALRQLMTQWDIFGDLTRNSVKNRTDFESKIVIPSNELICKLVREMSKTGR